jgi:hypothetical protein
MGHTSAAPRRVTGKPPKRLYAATANREPREPKALMREHVLSVELSMIRRIPCAAADSPGSGG